MAETWTPSPWRVSEIGLTNDGSRPVVSDDFGGIAWVLMQDHDAPRRDRWKAEDSERDANAHLIAAAPELYEALSECQMVMEEMRFVLSSKDFDGPVMSEYWKVSEMAEKAIRKARGET